MDIERINKIKTLIIRVSVGFAIILCTLFIVDSHYKFLDLWNSFSIFTVLYFPFLVVQVLVGTVMAIDPSPFEERTCFILSSLGLIYVYWILGKLIGKIVEKHFRKQHLPGADKPSEPPQD